MEYIITTMHPITILFSHVLIVVAFEKIEPTHPLLQYFSVLDSILLNARYF